MRMLFTALTYALIAAAALAFVVDAPMWLVRALAIVGLGSALVTWISDDNGGPPAWGR